METSTTRSFKDPVNEIVAALPATAATGYRVILTTDNKIYQFNGTEWEADADLLTGTMARLVGKDGAKGDFVSFYKLMNGSQITTPFYPSGGAMINARILIWNGSVHIVRTDGTDSDIVRYNPVSGDSDRILSLASVVITDFCVDATGNLWLGTDVGLYKIDNVDTWQKEVLYNTTQTTIPFDYIDRVAACGDVIWIINNQSNGFEIAKLENGTWTEMTDQFYSDTTIVEGTAGNRTFYDIFCDDGKTYFTLVGAGTWSGRLFYYNSETETFAAIALYATYAPTKFVVLANVLHSITGSESVIKIQNILTGSTPVAGDVVYTSPADILAKYLRANGTDVYAVNDAVFYQLNSSGDGYESNTDLDNAVTEAVSPADILDIFFSDDYVVFIQQTLPGTDTSYIVRKEDGWDYFPRNGLSKDDMRRGKVSTVTDGDTIPFSSALGNSGSDLMPITLIALAADGTAIEAGFSSLTNVDFVIELASPADTVYYCFAKIW